MAKKETFFTIKNRLTLLIVTMIIIITVVNVFVVKIFTEQFKKQNSVFSIYSVSLSYLKSFSAVNHKTLSLLKSWVYIDKDTGAFSKKEFEFLYKKQYPKLKQNMVYFVNQWDIKEQNIYYTMLDALDSLVNESILITDELAYIEDYNNSELFFDVMLKLSNDGILVQKSKRVDNLIEALSNKINEKIENTNKLTFNRFYQIRSLVYLVTFVVLIVSIFILLYTLSSISKIVNIVKASLQKLSKGSLLEIKSVGTVDEIGQIKQSINDMVSYLRKNFEYINSLVANDLSVEIKPVSETDFLGNSLLKIKNYLITTKKEEEQRQKENANRQWSAQGIAEISEVVRNNSDNLDNLSKAVVEKIVHYTGSQLGGLYIVNDESPIEQFLELKAFYAYDRFKFFKREIQFGETLIGQCYLEKEPIYINVVPDDYVYITSGLGKDKPKSILIVPLIFNEVVQGILELGSFEEMPDYKREFVQRVNETIASAISTVKINEKTRKLLEESSEKSKRLEEQEKETQRRIEEINKKLAQLEKVNEDLNEEKEKLSLQLKETEKTFQNKISAIEEEKQQLEEREKELVYVVNNAFPYFELSINDDFIFVNDLYLKLHNYTAKEILNTKHANLLARDFIYQGYYKQIWDQLKKLEKVEASIQYLIEGKIRFFTEIYVPIADKDGKLKKVAVIGRL